MKLRAGDRASDPPTWRFQTLVSCMLSSQTKDEMNSACMIRLKTHGLTVDNMFDGTTDEELREMLYGVSFHNTKAKNIREVAAILIRDYRGDIPATFPDLLKLPGVGPKMANIIMSACWGEVCGIAVDIHVHRICNRLGWVKSKTPKETEKALVASVPRELWKDFNLLLVGFGQQICRPVAPKCEECLVNELCPVGMKRCQKMLKNENEKRTFF